MNEGERLKNSVLQSAMEGKLVPQDDNDEPAEFLVKRIINKKLSLIKEKKVMDKTKPSLITEHNGEYFEKIGKKENNITKEIPFEIPASWEWVRLFSANDTFTGNSINKTEKETKYMNLSEGYNYIATKDVGFDKTVDYKNGVKIPFGIEKFRIAKPGSIFLCIEGGSAGRKIAFNEQEVCFGNKLCCFQSFEINSKFLFYYLQSPLFTDVFKSKISGIIGGVGVAKIRKMFLPIPPLNEQEKIVKKIEEILSLIGKYGKLADEIEQIYTKEFPEQIRKSILQEAVQGKLTIQEEKDEPASILLKKIRKENEKLIKEKKIKRNKKESIIYKENGSYYEKIGKRIKCVDEEIPFEIPETWVWCRLGDILTKLTDGTHTTPKYMDSGIPFLSVKDMSSGKLIFSNTKFISKEEHDALYKRCNPEKNDVLLTKVGTTGVPVLVDTDKEFSLFVSVALLKFNHDLIYNKYLITLINAPLVRKQCIENTKGVGNKNLVLRDINKSLIVLPPLKEQKRIVEKIEEILPLINKMLN